MVCPSVRSITPLLKLGDYLSIQAHKPWSISNLFPEAYTKKHHFLALQTPLAETDIYTVRSFPQTISDWNSLADFLISVAECA